MEAPAGPSEAPQEAPVSVIDELEAQFHINSGTLALLKSIIRPVPAEQVGGASASHSPTSLSAGRPARC